MTHQNSVCVGVDGTDGGTAAVRYAAAEAARLGVGLHLMHVIAMTVPITPVFPLMPVDLDPIGREILRDGELVAAGVLSSTQVTTSLHHGSPVASLVQAAEGSGVVVLGRQRRSLIERLLTGSTASTVGARSSTPVVVVPPGWTPRTERFHVVAGLRSTDHAEALARRALEIAAERDGRVTFVHAWELPSQYDDLIAERIDQEAWTRSATASIRESLEGLRGSWPEVPVEVHVVHGQAARVLQRESKQADLLLLSRREHAFPSGHLGGTVRALLRDSLCAVEVVPHADEHHRSGGRARTQQLARDRTPGSVMRTGR